MSMKTGWAALAAAALLASPALAQESPVVGNWKTVVATDMGNFEAMMTIAESDAGYTVDITDIPAAGAPPMPEMESTISDVVVDGASFSFKRQLTTPQGPMDLTYSGTVEGDTLTGTADSSFGAIPINGTRE